MNRDLYAAAWGSVASAAAGPVPRAFPISRGLPDTLPKPPNAIYIACNRDGEVVYVGSSIRTARRRLREHVRDRHRGGTWDSVWVIPLRDDLRESRVRIAEGRVGRLLKPTENKRLPLC